MSAMTDPASVYPAALRLAGRRAVVIGAGPVAQRRVLGLLDARADVLVIAPEATPAIEALADGGEIVWERRPYRAGDLAEAWYAVAAADDPAVNGAVAREAEAGRVFCSRADSAEDSTAWTPAVGRHDGVTVSVIGGGDPRRAVDVRDGVLEGLRDGTLAAPHHRGRTPGVALVGGGPGDPDLITVRGRRLLAEADVVVADRLGPRGLLDELAHDVEIIDASKIPYGRALAQEAINELLVERAKAGKFVVRLKGGDPFVFARGYEEVIACADAGIPVTVVPGVTSAIAVPALAGVPVTHRAVTHEFVVVSGHVAPGHPESLVNWDALAAMRGTIVLLMAVERIELFAKVLLQGGRPAETPVLVVQHGTTAAQQTLQTTLADAPEDIRSEGIRPPAIIVIGDVAAFAGLKKS